MCVPNSISKVTMIAVFLIVLEIGKFLGEVKKRQKLIGIAIIGGAKG
jgi:hypothetical protein